MVKLLSYERFEGANPSVVATVALEIDDLRIYNCRLYQNASGTRWIAPPSRPVKSPDGGASTWVCVVDFATKEARVRITEEALAAIDEHQATRGSKEWWNQ